MKSSRRKNLTEIHEHSYIPGYLQAKNVMVYDKHFSTSPYVNIH